MSLSLCRPERTGGPDMKRPRPSPAGPCEQSRRARTQRKQPRRGPPRRVAVVVKAGWALSAMSMQPSLSQAAGLVNPPPERPRLKLCLELGHLLRLEPGRRDPFDHRRPVQNALSIDRADG